MSRRLRDAYEGVQAARVDAADRCGIALTADQACRCAYFRMHWEFIDLWALGGGFVLLQASGAFLLPESPWNPGITFRRGAWIEVLEPVPTTRLAWDLG